MGTMQPMKRRMTTFFTLCLLLLLSQGWAQDPLVTASIAQVPTTTANSSQDWIGIRGGYPLGVTLHYGIANGFGNGVDLRISGRAVVRENTTQFGVGFDALRVTTVVDPVYIYIGGGPAFDFGRNDTRIDIHGLLGAELRFFQVALSQFGIFAEFSLGGVFKIDNDRQTSVLIPEPGIAVGFNYRF